MWIEAIFAGGDIESLLERMLPLTIDIGEDTDDHLELTAPTNVGFVAGDGLRVECEARLRWSVLGIQVPITIREVKVILCPEVLSTVGRGDALSFRLRIEHADVANVPGFIDAQIVERVNAALAAEPPPMTWDFAEMLSGSFVLPASLHPLETLSLSVAWGEVRVTDEAMVLAISFHSQVTRHGEDAAPIAGVATPSNPPRVGAVTRTSQNARALSPRYNDAGKRILLRGATFAFALAGAYAAFRLGARYQRRTRFALGAAR